MNKLKIAIKNFVSPLPDPERLLTKFWLAPLSHLSSHRLKLIIDIVIEEAKISRNFGLFIRPKDLENEVLFWLTLVNHLGVNAIRESDYDQIYSLASTVRLQYFDEVSRYYFNLIKNSKPKITNANTAYQCHLESVQAHILKDIFDGRLPFA